LVFAAWDADTGAGAEAECEVIWEVGFALWTGEDDTDERDEMDVLEEEDDVDEAEVRHEPADEVPEEIESLEAVV
jgi:hypothetical protein